MSIAPPGSFVWYDNLTIDPKAAADFYAHVIGWKTQALGESTYTLFLNEGTPVAGTEKLPDAAKKMGAPPQWVGNVRVADVDATCAEVKKLGGRVYAEAEDYPNIGRLAVIADPFGASVHVYAPSMSIETRDWTKHGEPNWHELMSEDHEAAFAFYSALFGWKKTSDFDLGPAMGKYLLYNNGGADLGGMFTKPKEMPASVWMYYVHVDDLDAALLRATSKGARVVNGPMKVPTGARIVQLADPQGAMFALHGTT